MDSDLRIRSVDEGEIQLIDNALDLTLATIRPLTTATARSSPDALKTGSVILEAVTHSLPQLKSALSEVSKASPSGVLQVVFSPEVTKRLATGQLKLMNSAKGSLPIAVNAATGKTVEIGRVVSRQAGRSSGDALKGGGAIALGAAAWPVALAVGVALAASWAEQRWLENNFRELHSALQRIELRLRDDNFGVIEAADELVGLIRPEIESGNLADLHRTRLAIAQQSVEGIYLSRRRFVDRFKHELEQAQTRHEEQRGERKAWVSDIADEIADSKAGVADELTVFLAAMICRARLTAASATLLATEGHPEVAVRLALGLEDSLRADYFDLYRRVRALAKWTPEDAGWRVLPFLKDKDNPRAHAAMQSLVQAMERSIGDRIPESREALILEANASAFSEQ